MLGYLLYDDGLSKIVLTDTSPQEIGTSCKPLIECSDEELSGIPVFQNNRAVGIWPNQATLLDKTLIEAIALQFQMIGFAKIQTIIEGGIYQETGKLSREFAINRCPYIELKLSQSRSLCLTVIPKGHSNYIKEISNYDEDWEIQKYIQNPSEIKRLIPNHSLPFARVDFDNVLLSVSEYIDRQYNTELCSYLQTQADVKKNFIDPCLTIIKLLHSQNYMHGDITDTNLTLSTKYNKLIFIDFQKLMRLENDIERLEDLRDVACTIYNRSPSQFKNNPAILYLFVLQKNITKILSDYEDSNDPAELEIYKRISINTLINRVERFWYIPLPDEIKDIDFSNYLEQKTLAASKQEAIMEGYMKACKFNNTNLMSFYEEFFPFCRINLKSLMPNDNKSTLKRRFAFILDETDVATQNIAKKSTRLEISLSLESNGIFKPQKNGNIISQSSYFSLK